MISTLGSAHVCYHIDRTKGKERKEKRRGKHFFIVMRAVRINSLNSLSLCHAAVSTAVTPREVCIFCTGLFFILDL